MPRAIMCCSAPHTRPGYEQARRRCSIAMRETICMSAARRFAVVIATVVTVAGFHGSANQIVVPAAASLDLHVPAPPMPVRIGGRLHLVYELHITNFRSTDLTLTRVDVFGDRLDGAPLVSYQDAALRTSLARAGARRGAPDPHL